jgi:hypothetical protein
MNLVAGIYQELAQDERIRGGMKYGDADDTTAIDTNNFLKELNVPYHPVVRWKEKGVEHEWVDRGGWWDWCSHDKKWRAEYYLPPKPGPEATDQEKKRYADGENYLKDHPEVDGDGGWDPETGKMLVSRWEDPADPSKDYVQYVHGGGSGNIVDHDIGHVPDGQTSYKTPIPSHFGPKK